ncbi:MAG TPA: hypothetical protein VGP79_00065 [Bryobacteraceae bacterium]|jgi:uncharacterized protein (TIGR03437 family)|nr:hypothetical protein [Bryobacteraceae bacterium]
MQKYCALISLCAGAALAGDFVTGQAARLVIGQPLFTQQQPGASEVLLGAVGGVAFAGDTLFVTDSNTVAYTPINNRVLFFRNVSTTIPGPRAELGPYTGRCPVCTGTAELVLGQATFTSTDPSLTRTGFNKPTGIASDGKSLVVADTQNNRVLIWLTLPTSNGQPADVVLGQANFTSVRAVTVDAKSFRRPQGVWIQDGKLYVADSQNNRVLIWNTIPTANDTPANVVLGQPNFNTAPEPDLTLAGLNAAANTLLNPISVTSDGKKLFVTDLGHNRVMIWNTIPTTNQAAADVVIGALDFQQAFSDPTKLCAATGKDADGKDTFPARCAATLDTPRFALSDGTRLFVADGGNDRVLIFNTIPTANGARADVILGQVDEFTNRVTSTSDFFNPNLAFAGVDVTPTPTALAWDGTNLYVTDPTDRRILVFFPGDIPIPLNAVRNAASREIFAIGSLTLGGTIKTGDTVTVTINGRAYTYTIVDKDTFDSIAAGLVNLINANGGDVDVFARYPPGFQRVDFTARKGGDAGNNVTLATSVSTNAQITALANGGTLSGGRSAAIIAPGTIVSIIAPQLADLPTAAADPKATQLPLELAGVQVYFDGIRAPLFMVAPGQINAQMPFEVTGDNSVNAFVRIKRPDGSVFVTTAVGVPIAPQSPGIFAEDGPDPRPAMAYHGSSYATGLVSVDGSVKAGDTATITIEDRSYSYTVQSGDTLAAVRDALIVLINSNPDEKVIAFPASTILGTRVRLRAKIAGPEGNGIPITVSVSTGAAVILTATNSALCCANFQGARITLDNPAAPGETIVLYATGLGLVSPEEAKQALTDGGIYQGPPNNDPDSSVSALAGGSTANVLAAGLKVGSIGLYEVVLELNASISTNLAAQVTISQDIYTSNIVTIPIVSPLPPSGAAPEAAISPAPAPALKSKRNRKK